MTKAEFVRKLAARAEMPIAQVEKLLRAFNVEVEDLVTKGDSVNIGLGTFKHLDRGARPGRNPNTGERITIPATKVPVFKPSDPFRRAVASK